MEFHNINEDIVVAEVDKILSLIEKHGNPGKVCLCEQCRMDTICYVLNRIRPYYTVSSRGVARAHLETIEEQQKAVDIVALVYDGIERVNHNMRPGQHIGASPEGTADNSNSALFNIPTMIGRVFNGLNFAPMTDIDIELREGGALVAMMNGNWPNPYQLSPQAEGTFTFWPQPVPADSGNSQRVFEFSLSAKKEGFESLCHFFNVPVVSTLHRIGAFSMEKLVKLPDLYMFPPGGEDE